jgi:hypothetical protein
MTSEKAIDVSFSEGIVPGLDFGATGIIDFSGIVRDFVVLCGVYSGGDGVMERQGYGAEIISC